LKADEQLYTLLYYRVEEKMEGTSFTYGIKDLQETQKQKKKKGEHVPSYTSGGKNSAGSNLGALTGGKKAFPGGRWSVQSTGNL